MFAEKFGLGVFGFGFGSGFGFGFGCACGRNPRAFQTFYRPPSTLCPITTNTTTTTHHPAASNVVCTTRRKASTQLHDVSAPASIHLQPCHPLLLLDRRPQRFRSPAAATVRILASSFLFSFSRHNLNRSRLRLHSQGRAQTPPYTTQDPGWLAKTARCPCVQLPHSLRAAALSMLPGSTQDPHFGSSRED